MLRSLTYLFLLLFLSNALPAQTSFKFQNTEVKPGSLHHFIVPINTGNDSTFIPITIFNGVKDGKTFGITAGVHGYEYAPIMAGQKLVTSIDPKKLNGVIILVQVAGLESFLKRSPYVSPTDLKNLNRSFPGSANGTNTDKVAHFITEQIIARSDFFLDIHSGDAPEDLIHYSAYYSNSNMPKISSAGKAMAAAMGFDYILDFNTDGKDYIRKDNNSLYCSAEAFKRGIPATDIECGGLGTVDPKAVDKIEKSVLNVLDYLKFQSLRTKSTHLTAPKVLSDRVYISSDYDGLFYASMKAGDVVKKGMKLGYVTDFFGRVLQDIYAKEDGLLMLIISTPPINKMEDVAVTGKVN